ncbi:DUF1493 family protein [Tenacibaculum sp. SDUM215027]|uniref:DUF1493 family protein n=1 Tax=Tenacibaculum sp. SDUM215027 TaxID=3422596 RepID=UPI003D3159A9
MKITNFIKEKTGYLITNFNLNFDVEVGIDGLDAEHFFKEFACEFNIDMSSFDFDRYFSDETFSFKKTIQKNYKYFRVKRQFSFNHLLDVIESKKWFDPN